MTSPAANPARSLLACLLLAIAREVPRVLARENLPAGEGLAGFVTLAVALARPLLALHDGLMRLGLALSPRRRGRTG